MPVLYPHDLKARKQYRLRQQRRQKRRQFRARVGTLFVVLVVATTGLGAFSFSRPVAATQPSLVAIPSETVAPLSLPWPSKGQAAVGAVGYGVLDQYKTDKPRPTASTAKIFAALMIMKAKPLKPGQQGPMITITAADEAIYHKYLSQDGSVYPVTAGQQISERRALQALLLPSANNIADLLVTWAYGSMKAYTTAANDYFKSLGFTHTTLADASGFKAQTVSTAHDLTLAGELLMQDPVLSAIVAQPQITVPGVGVVYNTNVLLGHNKEVVGIKTGHTDEAGGCFVIAVRHMVDGQPITIVSAVLGATDVASAMRSSQHIVDDAKLGFAKQTLVSADQVVAQYQPAWGSPVEARAAHDLSAVVWLPKTPPVMVKLTPAASGAAASASLGTASATVAGKTVSTPVVLDRPLPTPPASWRLYKRYF